MNELEFKFWLINNGYKPKVACDTISRLKRIEREFENCDIDEQYCKDRCAYLLSMFSNMGKNKAMEKQLQVSFPIGKYYMSTYRYAIKLYVTFCDEFNSNKQ